MKRPAKEKWFRDRQQVADYFGVTRMTLYRWEKNAKLNQPVGWGHTRYISLTRVREWLLELRNAGLYINEPRNVT